MFLKLSPTQKNKIKTRQKYLIIYMNTFYLMDVKERC